MKLIKESIEFKRGQKPNRALGVGMDNEMWLQHMGKILLKISGIDIVYLADEYMEVIVKEMGSSGWKVKTNSIDDFSNPADFHEWSLINLSGTEDFYDDPEKVFKDLLDDIGYKLVMNINVKQYVIDSYEKTLDGIKKVYGNSLVSESMDNFRRTGDPKEGLTIGRRSLLKDPQGTFKLLVQDIPIISGGYIQSIHSSSIHDKDGFIAVFYYNAPVEHYEVYNEINRILKGSKWKIKDMSKPSEFIIMGRASYPDRVFWGVVNIEKME